MLQAAVRLSGERTNATAVEAELKEYGRLRRKESLLDLPENIRLEEHWQESRDAALEPG
ncbi:hypothetical protein BH24ACT22_BH24ACT22_18840 [soil metagenome]